MIMPNIKIIFLGTSSCAPVKSRNLTGMLVNYQGVNYLFDAPENSQQQIMKAEQSIMKINCIFITHMHGDHYFGILGLLATMQLNNREDELQVFVPMGARKQLLDFIKSSKLQLGYQLKISEVGSGKIYSQDNVEIATVRLNHSVNANGYVFKIKDKVGKFNKLKALKLGIPEGPLYRQLQDGKSIKLGKKIIYPKDVIDLKFRKKGTCLAYLLDTVVLKEVPRAVQGVDLLVHEASFFDDMKEKAKEVKHSVASEVASFAKKAQAKSLYLVHISPRYDDLLDVSKEVSKIFKNVKYPNDLDKIEIEDYL